jgi:phosphoserine aminotransferase
MTHVVEHVRTALNFSAGPAILPESVLEQAREDLWDIDDSGIGVLEHSHRGAVINRVFEEAEADCRRVGGIPDDFSVLFLQGGASMQFAMIAMNFLKEGRTADYLHTGAWTERAIADARIVGNVHLPFDGTDGGFKSIPANDALQWSTDPVYAAYCSNNTIYGTRFNHVPNAPAPLIADMSSEMFSRPIDWSRHAMVYAGAQKNLGPAGVTLAVIRTDLLEQTNARLPSMLQYALHAKKGSRYNTPPVFGVYICGLVFKWIESMGGVEAMSNRNDAKAKCIYDAIDHSGGFWSGHADIDCRSAMNIPFVSPSGDQDTAFLERAGQEGMSGLKGHRSVGGLRASIYNAFPDAGCNTLAQLMRDVAAAG